MIPALLDKNFPHSRMSPLEQLRAFVSGEREHNPGKTHIAQWALETIERLQAAPAQAELKISTEHGPWIPSQHHDGETYCERCNTRSVFSQHRPCDPHIVSTVAQAEPLPEGFHNCYFDTAQATGVWISQPGKSES